MSNIAIIDIGIGNIFSLKQAVSHVGGIPTVINKPVNWDELDGVILPGVGSFEYAMRQLKEKKFDIWIHDLVKNEVPLFGICLGMQLLFEKSFEGEKEVRGLGVFPGEVLRIPCNVSGHKLPNMGWRAIKNNAPSREVEEDRYGSLCNYSYYFMHSYHVVSSFSFDEKFTSLHGDTSILSFVKSKNIIAMQFHPEKSSESGMSLFDLFLTRCDALL